MQITKRAEVEAQKKVERAQELSRQKIQDIEGEISQRIAHAKLEIQTIRQEAEDDIQQKKAAAPQRVMSCQ